MILLCDIGGTRTRIGVSDDGQTILKSMTFPTPVHPETCSTVWSKHLASFLFGESIDMVIGGLPGVLSADKQTLVYSPALPHWRHVPFVDMLSDLYAAPVYLENDAALVGLGEAVYGAGKGEKIVAYMSMSTGVGGVRVVDGYIDVSKSGFEPGHQLICAKDGTLATLDSLVSGLALRQRFHCDPIDIKEQAVWDEVMYYMAIGIYNVIVCWSPDMFVLGGAIARHTCNIAVIKAHVQSLNTVYPELPYIVLSELGDMAGLYGALTLAKAKMRILPLTFVGVDSV